MGFKREDIRDVSPLSLKKLNDTLRYLWLHSFGNIDFADLSDSTQTIINGKLTQEDIANVLNTENFNTIITKDYIASMNLIVGQQIAMGSGAVINWTNVTPPNASQVGARPSTWTPNANEVGALPANWTGTTYINSSGIYTGIVVASQINSGTINADNVSIGNSKYTINSDGFSQVGGFSLQNTNELNCYSGSPFYINYRNGNGLVVGNGTIGQRGDLYCNAIGLGQTVVNPVLSSDSNALRVENSDGYLIAGPQNVGFCHFMTDRPTFYFNVNCQAVGGFSSYSDRTLKTDIMPFANQRAVDIIKDLDIQSFKYKNPNAVYIDATIGIITDQAPVELITHNEDMDSINLYSYISVVASALQDTLKRIENLEAQIVTLGGVL